MTSAKPIWTLERGLELARQIQPFTRRFRFHLTLGGGVLNKGVSNKDLDLYFLPLDNGEPSDPSALKMWLDLTYGVGRVIGKDYGAPAPSNVYVHKLEYVIDGGRVDVFIMGERA